MSGSMDPFFSSEAAARGRLHDRLLFLEGTMDERREDGSPSAASACRMPAWIAGS
jgi:hypothetical protein